MPTECTVQIERGKGTWSCAPSALEPFRIAVMDAAKGTVERAFELARSGSCQSVEEVRRALVHEGYEGVRAHLAGAAIGKQLKTLLQGED